MPISVSCQLSTYPPTICCKTLEGMLYCRVLAKQYGLDKIAERMKEYEISGLVIVGGFEVNACLSNSNNFQQVVHSKEHKASTAAYFKFLKHFNSCKIDNSLILFKSLKTTFLCSLHQQADTQLSLQYCLSVHHSLCYTFCIKTAKGGNINDPQNTLLFSFSN